ncbi:ubiquinol-cytochrome c reductase complex assembly factor 2-like [Xylocopa sonorina]|uniref:ubiquinol-cytochrome c reductase complex assembly factor 2-like n=1 Tax=Xylocopa sonorina TaxID=1818115 RepID=UPI00403AD44A
MGTYRNYMKLLESWPLDNSKPGRDLAQHIRDQLKLAFAKGEASEVNREECDRYYKSLKRICSNHYGQMYKRTFSNSATGLTREQCNLMLSPEALKIIEEDSRGFFSRTFSRLSRKNVEKDSKK